MYKVEFVATRSSAVAAVVHAELALTRSLEEAKDLADTHLPAIKAKYGATGYRIIDENNTVVTGPKNEASQRLITDCNSV